MSPTAMTKFALDQTRAQTWRLHPSFSAKHRTTNVLHHRTAEFQLRTIVARPGVPANFRLYRIHAALDAVRTHRHEVHRLRPGSHPARSRASVVRSRRRAGLLTTTNGFPRASPTSPPHYFCSRRLAISGRRITSSTGIVSAAVSSKRTTTASRPTTRVPSGWDCAWTLLVPRCIPKPPYPKGAYILQMLRSMMWNADDQDKAFIEMMHDFVASHRDRPATTESFKAIAKKHIPQNHGPPAQRPARLVFQ